VFEGSKDIAGKRSIAHMMPGAENANDDNKVPERC
jgi:hypothetical protein